MRKLVGKRRTGALEVPSSRQSRHAVMLTALSKRSIAGRARFRRRVCAIGGSSPHEAMDVAGLLGGGPPSAGSQKPLLSRPRRRAGRAARGGARIGTPAGARISE